MLEIIEILIKSVNKVLYFWNEFKPVFKNKLIDNLKKIRKKDELPSNYYNQILRNAINTMIDINFISFLKKPSGQVKLADNYEENLKNYIETAFRNQN